MTSNPARRTTWGPRPSLTRGITRRWSTGPCNGPKGTRNAPGCVEHLQARTPRSHSLQAAGPTVPTPPLGLLHPADWRVPSVTSLLHFIAFGSGLWAITVGRLSI